MAGGVVGLVYAANIEKVSERKPGERDWCHMAPLISATLNPSLSMQSQTSNLSHQVADQQQLKQSCNQRLTVKGEYAAETKYTAFSPRLTICFQLLDFPLQTFEHFNNLFETFVYLDLLLRLLQSVHLRFQCVLYMQCSTLLYYISLLPGCWNMITETQIWRTEIIQLGN